MTGLGQAFVVNFVWWPVSHMPRPSDRATTSTQSEVVRLGGLPDLGDRFRGAGGKDADTCSVRQSSSEYEGGLGARSALMKP